MSDTAEILEQAARWREAGKGVALATVVSTWGSSPRPLGSKLAVDSEGAFIGSGSGGCVAGAGLRRQDRDLCRARRMKGRFLDAVIAAARDHRSVALAIELKSGHQLLLDGDGTESEL